MKPANVVANEFGRYVASGLDVSKITLADFEFMLSHAFAAGMYLAYHDAGHDQRAQQVAVLCNLAAKR